MALLSCAAPAAASLPSRVELAAAARAGGNDRATARALARALLARPWAAQIVKVRVERAGSHRVAGIVLSGVKLKRRISPAAFLAEANALVDMALRSSSVEEVDLWATVPLGAGAGMVTSGDYAKPTSRTVFSLTARRDGAGAREPYWDPGWRAGLGAATANR